MNQVHEVYNFTPFISTLAFTKNNEGHPLIVCVLKATFEFDKNGAVTTAPRERMLPILFADTYYESDAPSSVRFPTDLTPHKDGTDIIINGHAYGNHDKQILCGFTLGHLGKTLQVSGHRVWNKIMGIHTMTGPFPFEKIPVTYEHAFGGCYQDKKGPHVYPYNPVGKGLGAKYAEKALLPNIEYRNDLIHSVRNLPKPAAFGAIAPTWAQRLVYAGTFDDTWKNRRYPLGPSDMDPAFYNAAPHDQIYRPKLKGGEELSLLRLHPSNPEIGLTVPKHRFTCTARIKTEALSRPMVIDTCLIEPDEQRLSLTYISRFPLNSDNRYLKTIHIEAV
ncbi:MAG: DUF2169 domain-containing protein [Proteobacteria bacterium]|nr:DUF2169 domain-containing protein [Pseudomonadota bacterium]